MTYKDYWKVTIIGEEGIDLDGYTIENKEVHNRVSNEGLGEFLNHYKEEEIIFKVEPLSELEYLRTEK